VLAQPPQAKGFIRCQQLFAHPSCACMVFLLTRLLLPTLLLLVLSPGVRPPHA
jgi:hypothetical protein